MRWGVRSKYKTAWFVWGLAALYYFSDYLARVSPGVIHQDLQSAFSLTEAGFGLMTYAFYLPYIIMQIPVGLLVDRFSIRKLLTCMSLITGLGCVFFGCAQSLMMAVFGRMLIGFSSSCAFIAAMRLATVWFPVSMLGLLAGLTQALGMLGAAAGEAPIAALAKLLGWRSCMLVLAGLFLVLAFVIYTCISEKKLQTNAAELKILPALQLILKNKQLWCIALYAGCLFGPTAVIGEAYGPALLQYGWGLTATQAANAIGYIFIGWGLGGPIIGWLSDYFETRRPLMIISALCTCLFTLIIVYLPMHNMLLTYGLFFLFGLTNCGVCLAYALASEITHKSAAGLAIALTNMASIFVGATLQPIVGKIIDTTAGLRACNVKLLALPDFQHALVLIIVAAGLALLLSLFLKKT